MKPERRIRIFSPHIPQSVIDAAVEALKSKWINVGQKTYTFEKEFAKMFNMKYSVAVNSCTSALRLAYAIAGIGPGDEVITTPFTMVATNTAILEQYAVPVFADVQYETANIDPYDVERRITKKTKAIVCVHNLGYPCDLKQLVEIADEYNLALIEDCAHALGAKYHGEFIGSNSDYACFSFHAVKHITTGDGGMFVTRRQDIFEKANRRSWFGMDRKKRDDLLGIYLEDITEVGYKMRMNDFLAAIGLAQLPYIHQILEERREKAKIYKEELEGIKGITLMEYKDDRESSYYLFPLHVERRWDFAKAMRARGIEVYAQNFRNDRFSIFGGLRKDLPNVDRIDKDFVCLPIHQDITFEDQKYIIEAIKKGW
jgi:perosamine synthetase